MPTIGFFELLLISVVALLVLGPERLPGAIRTTSLWVGRARRSFNKVKSEIERELNTDEIRRQLHNESILADLEKAKKQANEVTASANRELKKLGDEVEAGIRPEMPKIAGSTAGEARTERTESKESIESPVAAETVESPAPANETNAEAERAAPGTPATKEPVQDFYNNPGIATVELRNGVVQPVPAPDPEAAPEQPVKK